MTFTFAQGQSVAQLCALFNQAFSDYVLPMVLTEPLMELKLIRDGMQPSLSPLALQQGEPVAFILNAVGKWHGKQTAYNGGTGVVPAARGQALPEKLYQYALPLLKAQGVEQCLLEVLQENKRAFRIYEGLGFAVTRSLHCFRQVKAELHWHRHPPHRVTWQPVTACNWPLYQTFWEVEPSWQHHTAALDRSYANIHILEAQVQGQCVGYGVVYPVTGAIAQLAVAPAWRGQGIGQALLQQLISQVTAPAISFTNVDARAESMLRFLKARQVTETLPQFEMVWPL